MADFSNGNPPEQPSESNSNEVQSPIVMRIDAPEAEKPVEEEPPTYSFAPTARSHLPYQPSSSNSFGSDLKFCSSSSSNQRSFGLGVPNPMSFSSMRSSPSAFGVGLFGSFSKPVLTSTNASSSSSPKPLLLRPSQLAMSSIESSTTSSSGNNEPSSTAQERVVSTSELVATEPDSRSAATIVSSGDTTSSPVKDASATSSSQEKNEPSSSQAASAASQSGSMKFVPLGASSSHHKDDSSSVSGSGVSSSVKGFVFGQNLHARAATAASVAVETADSTSAAVAGPSKAVTSNGTSNSEMLFTSAVHSEPATADSSVSEGDRAPSKSLSEAAAEYEESRAVKRKYDEVAVFTGEEDEANVVQLNCKLFAYDKAAGQWVERGRGTLRLNDKDGPGGVQSRVVMRTAGSLRVVLNTKIWGGMSVDRPSQKSIRLTAMEGAGQIKVFLVMGSPKEIEALHKSLQSRVLKRQLSEAESGDAADTPTAFQNKRREVQDAGGGEEEGDEEVQ